MPFLRKSWRSELWTNWRATVDRLFSREDYVEKLGHKLNPDGTTDNICSYQQHVRENIVSNVNVYFGVYFVWSTFGGLIIYLVCQYALNGAINSDGREWDMWNGCGTAMVWSLVVGHHLLWSMETRKFDWVICVGYLVSFLMMPVAINASESALSSFYYKEQWGTVFTSGIFHLVSLWATIVMILPRAIWIMLEHSVIWPEFSKIKSA